MSERKVYEIDDGATFWVWAKDEDEAFDVLQECMGIGRGDMWEPSVVELTEEKAAALKFRDVDTGDLQSLAEMLAEDFAMCKRERPLVLGSTEF